MCVARFTQERGAKSSFERVVGTLEGVLSRKGVLVRDRDAGLAGEVCAVVGG